MKKSDCFYLEKTLTSNIIKILLKILDDYLNIR